jgi:pantetheine-phosphate adenylyltransferase
MNVQNALITGSFDPPTLGHLDVIKRSADLFDEVRVCIFRNSEKKYMFDEKTRLEMLKALCADIKNVVIDCSDKPVAIYAKENSIPVIVKGVRGASDFEYEKMLHQAGNDINPNLETVILFARPELERVSSSIAREFLRYGLDTSAYLSPEVAKIANGGLKK